jgi:hypothetical protein
MRACLLVALFVSALPAMADPAAAQATTVQVPRSIFHIPANSKEGRDPFFPSSFYPYAGNSVPGAHTNTTDLTSLVMQGVSGVPPHQLVVINDHTFAVGDDGELRTSQGLIRIHCLEINKSSAVIQANGQQYTLHFGDKP